MNDRRKTHGRSSISVRLLARYEAYRLERAYQQWIPQRERLDDRLARVRADEGRLTTTPLISIVVPVFNVPEIWLRKCIDSVLGQIYENWELCIADDRSTLPHIGPLLNEYAARDDRIKVVFRDENGHISAATNSALELATGDHVAFLDNDDVLAADALYWIVKEIEKFPRVKLIYTDEDIVDDRDRRSRPKFKPEISRDLLLSVNYVNHLSVYQRDAIEKVGGLRTGVEGSQDYDLLLRVLESTTDDQVRRVPLVLYHWRSIEGSVAMDGRSKEYAHENARRAIRDHLQRTGTNATVERACFNLHQVRYGAGEASRATLLVSFGGLRSTVDGFDDDHTQVVGLRAFDPVEVNGVVATTSGEILCFFDSDIEPQDTEWLSELSAAVCQSSIGVAGGRIVLNGRVVDGGLIVGTSEVVSVAHEGCFQESPGSIFRNRVIGNYSAVSLSSMAIRRDVFESVDGFDENLRSARLAAADICLRIWKTGRRVVLLPNVSFERSIRSSEQPPTVDEITYFKKKWEKLSCSDPFYNPNFTYADGSFTIAN